MKSRAGALGGRRKLGYIRGNTRCNYGGPDEILEQALWRKRVANVMTSVMLFYYQGAVPIHRKVAEPSTFPSLVVRHILADLTWLMGPSSNTLSNMSLSTRMLTFPFVMLSINSGCLSSGMTSCQGGSRGLWRLPIRGSSLKGISALKGKSYWGHELQQ